MRALWLLMPLVGMAAPMRAQDASAEASDPRIEFLRWSEGAELPLRTVAGGAATLLFDRGEAIQSVLVGDLDAVAVHVAPRTDSLVLRTLRQPANPAIEIRTSRHTYRFRLQLGPAGSEPYIVRIAADAPESYTEPAAMPPAEAVNRYTVKGDVSLRPVRVSDDGVRTYLEWGSEQALPAVFAVNAVGEEETVDSYVRQGVTVIDRVYPRLIFRIGKLMAEARRDAGEGRR